MLRASVIITAVLTVLVIRAYGESGDAAPEARGSELYDRLCSPCHGANGGGNGPAAPWLWPKPRDFRSGQYKWRSTDTGMPPTDEDLRKTILHGVPGTSMHGFADILGTPDVDALISVLKAFAPKTFRRAATITAVPQKPAAIDLGVGKRAYARLGCQNCHGESAKGDGPSAATLKDDRGFAASPYDLTSAPMRRPLAPADDAVVEIYRSLVTGLSGTPMPSYLGSATEQELFAVAAYVDSLRRVRSDNRSFRERVTTSSLAIAADRQQRSSRAGYWQAESQSGSAEASIWGGVLALNSTPPRSLGPAQASLSAKQCARCHAPQYRQWKGSLHAAAASPGLIAQLLPMAAHGNGRTLESCQRCHAPLAEQLPLTRPGHFRGDPRASTYSHNPFYRDDLRSEGINCASCHIRDWKRHGPARTEGSKLLSSPGYPFEAMAIYERSDFCLACHQLPARQAVAGQPLLNTYREWLEGPYMRRGVQCQHCHMSNREHEWKGVHDPDTFRQGFRVEAISARNDRGVVSVRARMTNSGAGHYLPTTPTPAAWMTITLVDGSGRPVPGATTSKRIGRHLVFEGGKFVEKEDTRIPPGESIELAGAWKGPAVAAAKSARISVKVAPDDYYEGLYRARLRNSKITGQARRLFREALERAEASHYVAFERNFPIQQ